MNRYDVDPLDLSGLRTVPIDARGGKVRIAHMAAPPAANATLSGWLDRLPKVLAADALRGVIQALAEARARKRAIVWGLGGHVVKCGLAPVFIDLLERGYVTALALNGAASIHDFELGIAGATSEDVEAVLPDGSFGAAEETGREMNLAIRGAAARGIGMGEALGERLQELARPEFTASCLQYAAYRRRVPVTVHVAIGTDTPHTHPAADGAALGAASHHDFRLFAALLRELDDGGVYLNVGSAVLLPEVFLKAVSAVRNLGYPLGGFTTVNLDFLQHYRPKVNVVERPHAQRGGHGYSLTGHHEIMLPLIAGILASLDGNQGA
jgi:hypothetical protein